MPNSNSIDSGTAAPSMLPLLIASEIRLTGISTGSIPSLPSAAACGRIVDADLHALEIVPSEVIGGRVWMLSGSEP